MPFGRYTLLKRLAVGGMAELFLAAEAETQRLVAIKRILPYLSQEVDFVRMFLSEARIAAQLHHPNIVQVFELGKLEDSIFLAMEYVEGTDLRRMLTQQAKLGVQMPYHVAARVVADVCRGLGYAHNSLGVDGKRLDVVHRDVSPQNVMVAFDGRVKLVDFGIAKATAIMDVSKPGVIKGKFLYLSPEQVAQERVDHRADLFALGTLLYEITTGRSPFLKPTSEAVIFAIKAEEAVPPQRWRPDYPPMLQRIVAKCMEKDRSRRYQQGDEIADDLETFLGRVGVPSDAEAIGAYLGQLYGEEDERTLLHVPRAKVPPPLPTRAAVVPTPVLEPLPRRMTGEQPRRTSGHAPSMLPQPPTSVGVLSVAPVSPLPSLNARTPPPVAPSNARTSTTDAGGADAIDTASLRPPGPSPTVTGSPFDPVPKLSREPPTRRERSPEVLPPVPDSALPPPPPPAAALRLEDLPIYSSDGEESELTEVAPNWRPQDPLPPRDSGQRATNPSDPGSISISLPSGEPGAEDTSTGPGGSRVTLDSAPPAARTSAKPPAVKPPSKPPVAMAPLPRRKGRKPGSDEENTSTFSAEFTQPGSERGLVRRMRSTVALWAGAGAGVAILGLSLYRLACVSTVAVSPVHMPPGGRAALSPMTPVGAQAAAPPASTRDTPPAPPAAAGPTTDVAFQAPRGTVVLVQGKALALENTHPLPPGTLHYDVQCPGSAVAQPHLTQIPAPGDRPAVVAITCPSKSPK